MSQFRQAMSRMSHSETDFGSARNLSTIVVHLDLELVRTTTCQLASADNRTFTRISCCTPKQDLVEDVCVLSPLQRSQESSASNKSRMTLVLTSGAEKLAEDISQLRKREGAQLSRSMVTLGRLTDDLAKAPYPDRVVTYRLA